MCSCRYVVQKSDKINEITKENMEILEFINVPVFNSPKTGKIMVEFYACKTCGKEKFTHFETYEEKGFHKN